jgi:class 3 adenylate cyclase
VASPFTSVLASPRSQGPGEVLVSGTVKDLVTGSGLMFEDTGEHVLKGVPDRWRLYRVAG